MMGLCVRNSDKWNGGMMMMMMGGWDLKDLRDVGGCGVGILKSRDVCGREMG